MSLPYNMESVADKLYIRYGVPIVQAKYAEAQGDLNEPHQAYFLISRQDKKITGELILQGEKIAFVEFGAGIHYNGPAGQSPHPKGTQLGYTIGSYGYGMGRFESWYYEGEDGVYRISFGTKATMPLYSANEEMRKHLLEVVKEVFT